MAAKRRRNKRKATAIAMAVKREDKAKKRLAFGAVDPQYIASSSSSSSSDDDSVTALSLS